MSTHPAVDAAIDAAIAEQRIVGTVVLIARDGRTVYSRAAGLADREAGVPVKLDTIFRYASLSKPIVAATALAMIDKGLLTLDTPVAEVLDWFRPRLPDGEAPPITVHHLLTHTAGLGDGLGECAEAYRTAGIDDGLLSTMLTLDQNLRRLASAELRFEPGTAWLYSLAVDVLGAVLAKIHGGAPGDAVAAHVTGPLGMADTRFSATDPTRLAVAYGDGDSSTDFVPVRMGEPHHVANDADGVWFSPARILDANQFQSGGVGMAGTAGDFLRLLEALRDGGGLIAGEALIEAATSNRIGEVPMRPGDAGRRFGYLGAVVEDPAAAGTPQPRGTFTWGGLYGNSWFVDIENRLSVVALSNTALEGCTGGFPNEVRDAVYAAR